MIILFERPVRIGDTVTIGTFSGTVSKSVSARPPSPTSIAKR
ncbi:hypothetical protein CKQ90_25685 [Klebsiella pneumoniae]|nr:hypothetical protein CKQ90_25685 [Klebsiella pneumoniae]